MLEMRQSECLTANLGGPGEDVEKELIDLQSSAMDEA